MSVTNDVMMQVWQARSDLVLTSPYMIPGEMGMEAFRNLRKDKVKVTVITNSLAATDEPLVHTGYSRYRTRMLEAGVDLYELSPTRTQQTKRLGMFGTSLGRLHAKTAVIDRKTMFIGSMNLDPRSASTNTEFGMFIESPALAKELLRVINISKLDSAYRLRLDPKTGSLEWLTVEDDKEVVLGVEPESTFWLRVHNMLFGWFVPEQLPARFSSPAAAKATDNRPMRSARRAAESAFAERPVDAGDPNMIGRMGSSTTSSSVAGRQEASRSTADENPFVRVCLLEAGPIDKSVLIHSRRAFRCSPRRAVPTGRSRPCRSPA